METVVQIPGICLKPGSTTSASTAVAVAISECDAGAAPETSSTASAPEKATPSFEISASAPIADASSKIFSGRPVASLAHVFLLTTGQNPDLFESEAVTAMLEQTVGISVDEIRRSVPVDIIIKANMPAIQALCGGTVPESLWRALSGINAGLAKQAQEGMFHLCLRTFTSESDDVVALLAFFRNSGE